MLTSLRRGDIIMSISSMNVCRATSEKEVLKMTAILLNYDFEKRVSFVRGKKKERLQRLEIAYKNIDWSLYSRLSNGDGSFIVKAFKRLALILEDRSNWSKLNLGERAMVLILMVHLDLGDTVQFKEIDGSLPTKEYVMNHTGAWIDKNGRPYSTTIISRVNFHSDLRYKHGAYMVLPDSVRNEIFSILLSCKTYNFSTRIYFERRGARGYDLPYGYTEVETEDIPGVLTADLK